MHPCSQKRQEKKGKTWTVPPAPKHSYNRGRKYVFVLTISGAHYSKHTAMILIYGVRKRGRIHD
jgi:hypothetical protein